MFKIPNKFWLVLVPLSLGGASPLGAEDVGTHGDASQQAISAGQLDLLTRGPLHEAFASPVMLEAVSPPIVQEPVPQPIRERPPAVRPKANGETEVVWIPGYWTWNDVNDSWDWVTGTWRAPPPGHQWVAGYWTATDDGSQRVPGFWIPEKVQQLTYTPAPPKHRPEAAEKPLQLGEFRVPGHWAYRDGRFAWDAGYVTRVDSNWVWIPPQYHWSPRGYVATAGYWDYPLTRRGWLFAPVGLTSSALDVAKLSFTPATLLNVKNVSLELFARPQMGMYYFGDYYGVSHAQQGFSPWYKYARNVYDPIYVYQAWYYGRRNPNWLQESQDAMRAQAINPNRAGGGPVVRSDAEAGTAAREMIIPLRQFVLQTGASQRIDVVDRAGRIRMAEQLQRMRDFNRQRRRAELQVGDAQTDEGLPGDSAQRHSVSKMVPSRNGANSNRHDPPRNRRTLTAKDVDPDDLSHGALSAHDENDLTESSEYGGSFAAPGLSAYTGAGPSMLGLGAISGRNGMTQLHSSNIANHYGYGVPSAVGNTLGGPGGPAGTGSAYIPPGIGSGYQGGSPTGGINAPGGSYGLGTPGMGGGNFFGAGGGGPGHGSPGGGS